MNFLRRVLIGVSVGIAWCISSLILSACSVWQDEKDFMKTYVQHTHDSKAHVQKAVLSNGLTVLVRPTHSIPKVSLQLWYGVGSKDEKTGERGIAHLIEHMIFKGTHTLTESDINILVHKLSGDCNAFTSYDYTGYLFNMPTQHWEEVLPVMADCMLNVRFDDQMLNSEMKAVIQELKMYKDRYTSSLMQEMICTIFVDHPYHYPIIGFKQDLWNVSGAGLKEFYKKHYKPNNATLVVVGDVTSEEVFSAAEKYFGNIPADPAYKRESYYFNRDVAAKSVTLYRDIQQPLCGYAFVIPGLSDDHARYIPLLEWILGKGKGSRLYKKLVDGKLAAAVDSDDFGLFDHNILVVFFEPLSLDFLPEIERIVKEEIAGIAQGNIQEQEVQRALKKMQASLYGVLEDNQEQATKIGEFFLATGSEEYLFTAYDMSVKQALEGVQHIAHTYLRSCVMHKGAVLPLPENEQSQWTELQKESDDEDKRILSARPRDSEVEGIAYANTIVVKDAKKFDFPKPEKTELSNGIKLLWYNNPNVPKIVVAIDLKTKGYYDPENKQGITSFVSQMMTEGTENYTAQELADAVEVRGMSLGSYPGGVSLSVLHDDLEFGLSILYEVLTRATFNKEEVEKVRAQIETEIKNFWDEPRAFGEQLINEHIYQGHPYGKNTLGTHDSIANMTRDDLATYYKKYSNAFGARIAVVGDLQGYDVPVLMEKIFGSWKSTPIQTPDFPSLTGKRGGEQDYSINRDQVRLIFSKLSVSRLDPLYDKLLIFTQIFGGGALPSMASRLFQLRERHGLFYTIRGNFVAGCDEQPGLFQVSTIVSLDNLSKAEDLIKKEIVHAADAITDEEFVQAKRAIISSLVDNFDANGSIAATFLYADRFNFPRDFFDTRAEHINAITKQEVQDAVKAVLKDDDLFVLRIGRVK
ncbi:MAG TPA: pitrilysin family protein [Candidatus Bathyarchaeia archaeon]|nr:pitrilysin family protein [Candidatus Bathyarchaeia archaeon]